jgi:hypothetical protein
MTAADYVRAAIRARTARIPHLCDNCHWVPSLRGTPTIAPGHRYLLHTAFPDGGTNASDHPWSLKECVACAEDRDLGMRGTHLACCTYCCGTVPCALPFKHDGDHSCRRCAFRTDGAQ